MKHLTPLFFLLALAAPAYSQTIEWKNGDYTFKSQPSPLWTPDPANVFRLSPTVFSACVPDPDQKLTAIIVTTFYRTERAPFLYETIAPLLTYRRNGVSCYNSFSRVPSADSITGVVISLAPVLLQGGQQ